MESTTILPSYFRPGSSIGVEPVAMRTFFPNSGVILPSAPVTSTVLGEVSWAEPMYESTLFFLNRKPMPLVICFTTWSLRASMAVTSICTSPVWMPWWASLCLASWKRWELSSRALEGMQPMFRHVPPRNWRSTQATFRPSCAARMAAT